ncbi:hypothetical protein QR680_006560 [Steinernema hermaphroditum]|uniref:Gamma-glutamyltransferase n=1 Tax=Steinernema hermaphroditum TaxID=289476 RepID=A0AA39HY22_9BILA|nr:hypothetical protein QR680_006560 [Steinernema hermaphroditum]
MPATLQVNPEDRADTALTVKDMRKKGQPWIIAVVALTILVLSAFLLFFVVREFKRSGDTKDVGSLTEDDWPEPNHGSLLARFKKAAVVADNGLCAEVGRNILLRGGNAVDAAIATLTCVGGINSHSCGIGGGFIMTLYDKATKKCHSLDARETAPLATNENSYKDDPKAAFTGYKSIAVPGEVHGMWTAFKLYGSGRVAFQDLIMPTVHLLNAGYPVTPLMAKSLQRLRAEILESPSLRAQFVNPSTGDVYLEGEVMKNPKLADTLKKLSTSGDPVKLFYKGEMADQIAAEISSNGGFLTKEDLENYKTVVSQKPLINDHFDDELVMCGPPPSSSFAVTQLLVSLMKRYYGTGSDANLIYSSDQFHHRFIEAQKFSFAKRTLLADPAFVKEAEELVANMTKKEYTNEIFKKITDHALADEEYGGHLAQPNDQGTTHVSVIDADGNAVSLTSSINNIFGSRQRSASLGIIYNDQMDDFSLPGVKNFFGFEPSPANFIRPGKRPMSSMSPMIIYNRHTGDVKMAIGAAGGSKIISAVAQTIVQTLFFNQTLKEAVDTPRLHNQFTPIHTLYEAGVPEPMLEALRARGQNLTLWKTVFSTVQAILRDTDGSLVANSDHRRPVHMYPTGY